MNELAAASEDWNRRQSGTAPRWQIADRTLHFARTPLLMGIVNVTPDSFSDGGRWLSSDDAVGHAMQLVADGADILDVGGESTRPYSQPVSENEELQRVIPVIRQIRSQTGIPISIDTSKAAVAQAAIEAGAQIINDVTGLKGDPAMVSVARDCGAGVCAMHMQGTPGNMQDHPQYTNVVGNILEYLLNRKDELQNLGIEASRICLDPGIGFGKTHEHNLELLQNVARFHETGHPLLAGHSRKGFIGKMTGPELADRDAGTLGISLHLALCGVQIIRLHDVFATRHAIRTLLAVRPVDLPFCYAWPRPSASVDLVITRQKSSKNELLLIRRRHDPFAGSWALPGGFVEPNETLAAAAARELLEETGVVAESLQPVGSWSEPDRDPRGRVISTVFRATVSADVQAVAADDAHAAEWFSLDSLPELAFDHAEMIREAVKSIR